MKPSRATDQLVLRAFRPIIPSPPSQLGHQRDVGGAWKPLYPLDSVAVSANGPKVTVGVGTSETQVCAQRKAPGPVPPGSTFRLSIDLPVYTLYGLEEACLDVSEMDVGSGPRRFAGVDKVIVAGPAYGKFLSLVGSSRARRIVWW